MNERKYSLWTTLALLPAMMELARASSLLAIVYALSFITTLLYHASAETNWRVLDHALAYGVIGANTWMALHATGPVLPAAGVVFVCLALVAYSDAKANPDRYDVSHGVWHVLSGIAGFLFSLGYRG